MAPSYGLPLLWKQCSTVMGMQFVTVATLWHTQPHTHRTPHTQHTHTHTQHTHTHTQHTHTHTHTAHTTNTTYTHTHTINLSVSG